MAKTWHNAITDVPGIRVGHATDTEAMTGCTVVLCPPEGAVGGVDQRGGAPGTRETDLLRPMHLVQRVHAVLLAGGSAFGLDAAGGVVRWLEERGIGFDARVAKVPIVPAAVLFDLDVGRADVRPDAAMGYAACEAASDGPVAEGSVGAGTGCTVGKVLGPGRASQVRAGHGQRGPGRRPGGGRHRGRQCLWRRGGPAHGRDPGRGPAAAGRGLCRHAGDDEGHGGQDRPALCRPEPYRHRRCGHQRPPDKEEANKVAQMAHDGLARAVRPAHTMFDGDTLFALATGQKRADVNLVGAYAAEVVAEAIVRAVEAARTADDG